MSQVKSSFQVPIKFSRIHVHGPASMEASFVSFISSNLADVRSIAWFIHQYPLDMSVPVPGIACQSYAIFLSLPFPSAPMSDGLIPFDVLLNIYLASSWQCGP